MGREIYPHRDDLQDILMYECPFCHNRVGVHKGTTKPLGCIPTQKMKVARRQVHSLIDPLWKSGKITRKELYKRISEKVGWSYHTGATKNLQELREAYKIGLELKRELG